MNNLTLYQLTDEFAAIENALIENGGEITPELELALAENKESIATKVDGYNMIIRKMEGRELALDAEIKRLQEAKRVCVNSQKSVKQHMADAMKAAGIKTLEGNLCRVTLRKATRSLNVDEAVFLQPLAYILEAFNAQMPTGVMVCAKVSKKALTDAYGDTDVLPAGCTWEYKESLIIK